MWSRFELLRWIGSDSDNGTMDMAAAMHAAYFTIYDATRSIMWQEAIPLSGDQRATAMIIENLYQKMLPNSLDLEVCRDFIKQLNDE